MQHGTDVLDVDPRLRVTLTEPRAMLQSEVRANFILTVESAADAMQDTIASMKARLAKKTPVHKPIGAKL